MSTYNNHSVPAKFRIQDQSMVNFFALIFSIGIMAIESSGVAADPTAESTFNPTYKTEDDKMRVHFYNVGAGTCALVECPGMDARPLIVDCGTTESGWEMNSENTENLKRRIKSILNNRDPDVVLSHSDKDHVSLIPYVLGDIQASAIWQGDDPKDYYRHGGVEEWISSQQKGGAAVHRIFRPNWHNDGKHIANGLYCGNALSYVLTVNSGKVVNDKGFKCKNYSVHNDNNENSLVLMLKYGKFSIIFTGDATGKTEYFAMKNFKSDKVLLHATVLTASHHGAASNCSNSDDWIATTKPAVVIYSAGTKHGHPRCTARDRLNSKDTLAKTAKHNAICGISGTKYRNFTTESAEYMTRVNGNITITTDGSSPLRLDCESALGCIAVDISF